MSLFSLETFDGTPGYPIPPMSSTASPPVVGIRLPYWGTFAREVFIGIVDHMREHRRWRIETPMEASAEITPVRIDEDWKGDGLIVFRYTKEEAESWLKRGIKVMNFSSECLDPRIPTVTPDNAECGRLAARHLYHRGVRNFAFWGDPDRNYSNERRDGFVAELKALGHSCEVLGLVTHNLPRTGKAERVEMAMDKGVAALPRGTGVFAKDDLTALELSKACARTGRAIPGDLALIGSNDDCLFCYTATTPLSSVRYPGRLIGYRLAEQLDAMMSARSQPEARTLVPPSGVVERESTGIEPFMHPHVREAVRIIRELAPKSPLHVSEVLEHIAASRSALQERFTKEAGESMKQAIDRVRFEKLCDLLARTPLPVKAIAEDMGFESQEELSRFFRRMADTTPSDYRKRHRAMSDIMAREEES